MRSGALVMAGLAAAAGLVGAGASNGSEALRQAVNRTLTAPYVVVSQTNGRAYLWSRKLTVIKRGPRVIAWTAATEEFTWREKARCYQRSTQFNRNDVRAEHTAIAPSHLSTVRLTQRNGERVLSRRRRNTDSADVEYRLHLDRVGRLAMVRQRSAQFGVLPPGPWHTSRYRYPTAAQFASAAGRPPVPRCR